MEVERVSVSCDLWAAEQDPLALLMKLPYCDPVVRNISAALQHIEGPSTIPAKAYFPGLGIRNIETFLLQQTFNLYPFLYPLPYPL